MKKLVVLAFVTVVSVAFLLPFEEGAAQDSPAGPDCITCHEKLNPGLVKQWRDSKHATAEPIRVDCFICHGKDHTGNSDVHKARMPSPKKCGVCHSTQVKQFSAGKHALAEAAAKAIPMVANQPKAIRDFGCLGCHEIGRKWDDGSVGKCDSCHTRHLFSKEEAKKPEACETCHMGEDHSQYEMWRSSKHGVIHHVMPEMGRAPVCQTCHMTDGDHAVMTGWGFLALRLPIENTQWQKDVMTIVKAIGPWGLDEAGMDARVGAIKALKLARLDDAEFWALRSKMLDVCAKCHSREFGKRHMELADEVIRETTHVVAEAVRVVEKLYEDGILPVSEDGPSHPDLLLFYDSPTEIEQELYKMFLFHRQKAFQGVMHANPDYMHWYGWAPMKTSMLKITNLAKEMREKAGK